MPHSTWQLTCSLVFVIISRTMIISIIIAVAAVVVVVVVVVAAVTHIVLAATFTAWGSFPEAGQPAGCPKGEEEEGDMLFV